MLPAKQKADTLFFCNCISAWEWSYEKSLWKRRSTGELSVYYDQETESVTIHFNEKVKVVNHPAQFIFNIDPDFVLDPIKAIKE